MSLAEQGEIMKKALFIVGIIAIVGFILVYLAFRTDAPAIDSVGIHFAIQTSMDSASPQEAAMIQAAFLAEMFEDIDAIRRSRDNRLQAYIHLIICIFVAASILLYIYYQQRILAPFRKLEKFAHHIAAGNLDIPLEMDKGNLFGSFTESFDIMREELRVAKENEIKASKSKKELIASLVHDINTPVASISSGIDVLRLRASTDGEIKILDSASKKLEQIDSLITDLFHSTLEELQELKIAPKEVQSADVYNIIKQADYNERCRTFSVPDCLVIADLMRLQQVFDNIIKNSYKYAGTAVDINTFIEEEHLFIEVRDFGSGVAEKELPFLTGKFYRGTNTENTDGYGLGLYLSKIFMEGMQGGLYCENCYNGFIIVIMLRLAGE